VPVDADLDCLLADGRIIHLRHSRAQDRARLLDLHARTSERSRYLRFFSGGASIEREVDRLLSGDDDSLVSLVAEHGGRIVGVASYARLNDATADFAVLVDDLWQDVGVGTLLLEALAAVARAAGIADLVGDVLPANGPMLRVQAALAPGVRRETDLDTELLRVHVPTHPDEAALAAAALRDRVAERRSLDRLLRPSSVAVIGASRRPGSVGHEVLASLQEGGFTGSLYPVNPHAHEVLGLRAWPSIAAVPQPVDLAVIAVPPAAVAAVMKEVAVARVGAAVVLTSTVTRGGVEERAAEAEIVHRARDAGVRVVGPNCLGVLNTDAAVRLAATFAPLAPSAGGLAVATQSGAVGIAVLQALTNAGLGVSSFVSLGNKVDVSTNDLLAYWYDDPQTKAVALYVESFGNPRRFSILARALAARKPVLAVKSGRSTSGRRAGASHTAAAAAPERLVDALLEQAGVLRTESLGELLAAVRVFTSQPLPAGSRLGIVGNAGGLNVLAADEAERCGLSVPTLPLEVQRAFAAPALAAGLANPVDLGAGAGPADLARAVETLGRSDMVDALLLTFVATRANDAERDLAALAVACKGLPLPAVAVVTGTDAGHLLAGGSIPVFDLPEHAVRALGHLARYAGWRRSPRPVPRRVAGTDWRRGRDLVAAAGAGWQPATVSADLLSCYGVAATPTRLASDADQLVQAAEDLGYPVAIKAAAPELVHRTERGAVHLHLDGVAELRAAYAALTTAVPEAGPEVLVQSMAPAGVELAVGVVHDHRFGPAVTLRGGGTATELFPDVSLQLPPLTAEEATRMWRRLPLAPLLQGYRGSPAVDTAALVDLLLRIAQLAEDRPEVAELDLNPVVLTAEGASLVDVKLRLAPPVPEPDPYVRALSQPFRS
jgi:acyl-CoA synthetase (NDP forming)/GNAT superfamily N-acetyltransferase